MMKQIPLFKVYMSNDLSIVNDTLRSGFITQGNQVELLEQKLKEYFKYPYILTLNSATSGLTLAYRLLDLNPETDYVLSTPLTCFATNSSILTNNLNIIWCDTDPNTCNIDLDDVKRKITKNTKALTFVHWGGNPVNLNKVNEIKNYAKERYCIDLHVIEDCAHAFGAEFENKKLGTHNNICVFSLQAIKHFTCGDGGLIFLPNKKLYDRAKLLRWFGIDRNRRSLPGQDFRLEPDIPEYGYKFHMNDINASIGLINFPNIDNILKTCRDNGKYYNDNLQNIFGIKLFENIMNGSYWIYTIKILYNYKNSFMEFMKNKGIVTSQVHARNDNHSCVKEYKTTLPNLDIIETEIVSIPVGWWVTAEQREYIVNCIKEFSISLPLKLLKLEEKDIKEYEELISIKNNNYDKFDNIYVLKYENKIISSCKLLVEKKLNNNLGHIEDVFTHTDFRKKGFGRYLVMDIIDKALYEFNCYKVTLSCKNELENFYKKCGMNLSGLSFEKRK
jgi:dTDP-4-amino-4,6-dideoxygalactose transaminase